MAFDLLALFDPGTVDRVAARWVPGAAELVKEWRARQFQYTWLRSAGQHYADFEQVTEQALAFAARARGLELADDVRRELLLAYRSLEPWPDTRDALHALHASGLRLALLSNFTAAMAADVLERAQLAGAFDRVISTGAIRAYKPEPRAYHLAVDELDLPREAIAFAAFASWDACGGAWFGFPTFWVNRAGAAPEQLDARVDASGPDLGHLREWLVRS
ncbi:MAG TPA: haloacid dehalogenase type II [Rhodanobacteraceae bacterium]|nr:haloacid dehalogenase type II [Rhodanobacteraceae bacterium]